MNFLNEREVCARNKVYQTHNKHLLFFKRQSSVKCLLGKNVLLSFTDMLLLTFCSLLLPLLESVIVLCFVVRCVVSVLVLQ